MLKIALTGGIATGKSYVLEQFRRRGVPCLDADELAHGVTAAGHRGHVPRSRRASAPAFWPRTAPSIARSSGRSCSPIRRRAASSRRSSTPRSTARSRPACARFELIGGGAFAVVDVPLLFETGAEKDFDRVIVTACRAGDSARAAC